MTKRAIRVLTDENVSPKVVRFLRDKGVDVADVKELGLIGGSDADLVALAHREDRFILSEDADFGKLVIAEGHASAGIIYLRPRNIHVDNVIRLLARFLDSGTDIPPGSIVVIEEGKIRVRVSD